MKKLNVAFIDIAFCMLLSLFGGEHVSGFDFPHVFPDLALIQKASLIFRTVRNNQRYDFTF